MFPVIHLEGNFFGMGLSHGRSLAPQIKANISLYYKMVHGLTGLDKEQTLERSGKYLPVLQENAPMILEEMEGIALGAEVPLNTILFLNARTELMSMRATTGEYTASICRHLDPDAPEFLQMVTVASIILDLSGRKIDVSYGQPCQNSYQVVAL